MVAADGTTYVIVNTGQGHGGLGIANARGQTRVVPINGQIAQAIDNAGGLALTVGFDRKAYVAYVDNDGRYHVAIVTASGGTTIKDMPVGTTTKHRVYFTIKGVAAQIVQTTDQNTGAISTSAVVLSSGARTEQIPGELVAGSIDFRGNGYIVTSAENASGDPEVTVLAFTSAAKTIAKITAPGEIVLAVDNLAGPFGARAVVLAPDGTAYVTLSAGLDNPSGGAEVWAIKSTGKTKVLDVDTSLVTAVTVQSDGRGMSPSAKSTTIPASTSAPSASSHLRSSRCCWLITFAPRESGPYRPPSDVYAGVRRGIAGHPPPGSGRADVSSIAQGRVAPLRPKGMRTMKHVLNRLFTC